MDMHPQFIRNMAKLFQEWVKNYTTAHIKLREPVETGCENKQKLLVGNDQFVFLLTGKVCKRRIIAVLNDVVKLQRKEVILYDAI